MGDSFIITEGVKTEEIQVQDLSQHRSSRGDFESATPSQPKLHPTVAVVMEII